MFSKVRLSKNVILGLCLTVLIPKTSLAYEIIRAPQPENNPKQIKIDPAEAKKLRSIFAATYIATQYSMVETPEQFDRVFLAKLRPQDRKEILPYIKMNEQSSVSVDGDTVTFGFGKTAVQLQWPDTSKPELRINGHLWIYQQNQPLFTQIALLTRKLELLEKRSTAFLDILFPRAEAFPIGSLAKVAVSALGSEAVIKSAELLSESETAHAISCAAATWVYRKSGVDKDPCPDNPDKNSTKSDEDLASGKTSKSEPKKVEQVTKIVDDVPAATGEVNSKIGECVVDHSGEYQYYVTTVTTRKDGQTDEVALRVTVPNVAINSSKVGKDAKSKVASKPEYSPSVIQLASACIAKNRVHLAMNEGGGFKEAKRSSSGIEVLK
jgi:hypothetical protein